MYILRGVNLGRGRQWPANAARFWRKSKKKEKKNSVHQSGVAKSGLRGKKIAKKGKKIAGSRRVLS
jgi:hypothetical protein